MNWKQVQQELEKIEKMNAIDKEYIISINKECSTYLKSVTYGQKMFRGTNKSYNKPTKVTPRKDRKPRDTPSEIHNFLDKVFDEKFGVKARSEGVFCTPNFGDAQAYGSVYYVFPVGSFKLIYNPKVTDLYQKLRDDHVLLWDKNADRPTMNRIMDPKERDAKIKKIISGYKISTNNAKDALSNGGEVMLFCKEYFLVGEKFVSNYYTEIFAQCIGAPLI